MQRALLLGGYGTFGAHVAKGLVQRGVAVTIAGRDGARAESFARSLGGEARALAVDMSDTMALAAALDGHAVAVNCAGTVGAIGLVEECLARGVNHVDIAFDRVYTRSLRALDERLRARGVAAVHGCSSLPGLSGALALTCVEDSPRVVRARVTLFIGNDNPKGTEAVRSAVAVLGRPIATPQGIVRGFGDRESVELPVFGRRAVYNFDGPELDLFPALVGAASVSVKVGFELRLATLAFAALARLGTWGDGAVRTLDAIGGLGRHLGGCAGGVVQTEIFLANGERRRAALSSEDAGQRMAALPCALAVCALLQGSTKTGALTIYELLGAQGLVHAMVEEGFQLTIG